MNRGITFKAFVTAVVFFSLLFAFNGEKSEAATTPQAAAAVKKAEVSAEILMKATTIGKGYKGDGKRQPVTEYNAAKTAFKNAEIAVRSSKSKAYTTRIVRIHEKITYGGYYIDAISAGEKIEKKKAILEKQKTVTSDMVKAHKELTKEISKDAVFFNRVNGKATREKISSIYKKPAEIVRDEFMAPVEVKEALLKIQTGPSAFTLTAAKTVLLKIHSVQQPTFELALYKEWQSLKGKVTLSDAEYDNLLGLDKNLNELKSLVKPENPGVSNAKVPGLHQSIEKEIDLISNDADQWTYTQALENTMKPLFPDVKTIKTLITQQAIERGIPPEIAKTIALTESNFKQFEDDGEAFVSGDNGYGIMQVTQQDGADVSQDWDSVKYNLNKNIEAGLNILLAKWNYGNRIPTINNHEMNVLEDWYFAIMAYNGFSLRNIPGGIRIPYPIQVYRIIEENGLMYPEIINIADAEYSYNADSGQVIFNKTQYTTSKKTKSNLLGKEDDVITTGNPVTFRTKPTRDSKPGTTLNSGSKFTILSGPYEDDNIFNLFSWYKVKLPSGEQGYVASIW